jgi:hypothetical protein
MQVAIQTKRDGSMHMRLDEEAAKAMLASAKITEERLQANEGLTDRARRQEPCH